MQVTQLSKSRHTLGVGKFFVTFCVTISLFICLTADQLYGRPEGSRTLSIYNIHTKQTLTVTYKVDGKYIPSAMKKINHIMGDWRRKESRVMNKDLIDLMWEMHTELGSKKPIHLISGYRSLKTNNKLRKRGGGQARKSRHILGMAADVHFPDIPVRELRDSTLIRQRGGVGYYPTSGLPFVHMDVGRVRHWPRLNRAQLASLFPSGRSHHVPSDGRPLTKADAVKYGAKQKIAKMRRIQLARRRSLRGETAIAVASLNPTIKAAKTPDYVNSARRQLNQKIAALETGNRKTPIKPNTKNIELAAKTPVKNAIIPATKPETRPEWWRGQTIAGLEPLHTKLDEERQLVQLASIDTNMPESWQSFTPRKRPEVIEEKNVAYSPEFDEEHPEEFNYRPFSLSPLMTDQPVAENQKLAKLSPPDYAEDSVLLNDGKIINSSRFRPGLQFAHLRLANQFVGNAITSLDPPAEIETEKTNSSARKRVRPKKRYRKKPRVRKTKKVEKPFFSFW